MAIIFTSTSANKTFASSAVSCCSIWIMTPAQTFCTLTQIYLRHLWLDDAFVQKRSQSRNFVPMVTAIIQLSLLFILGFTLQELYMFVRASFVLVFRISKDDHFIFLWIHRNSTGFRLNRDPYISREITWIFEMCTFQIKELIFQKILTKRPKFDGDYILFYQFSKFRFEILSSATFVLNRPILLEFSIN